VGLVTTVGSARRAAAPRLARLAAVLATLLAVGALWLVAAPTAGAHALLVSSNPASGSSLTQLPKAVTATFSESVVPRLSSLQVVDASGRVVAGDSHAEPGDVTLTVAVPPLLSGVYTVRWKTVSSDDGHVANGSFTFGVGPLAYAAMSGPEPQLESAPSSASVPIVAGQWIFDVGLGLLVGGCWIAGYQSPLGQRRPLILAMCGAGTLVAGLAVTGWAQARADRIGLGQLAGTSLGLGLIVQAVPGVGAAAGAAAALFTRDRARRVLVQGGLWLAAAAALGHVLTSHAASGSHADVELFLQWLHVASFATWIGGLAVLLASIGVEASPAKAAVVRRFSRVAGYSLAALCVSGALRALDEVGAWRALVDTLFGRLVLLKIGLVGVLALLGAYNRFRSVPAAGTSLKKLRRTGSVELGVAALALVAAATLSSSLPPALAQAAPVAAVPPHTVVYGTADGFRASLEVSPGYPGPNRFTLRLFDATSGKPVPATGSTTADLVLSPIVQASADEAANLALARAVDGSMTAIGDGLTLTGQWKISADLRIFGRTVVVPFDLDCAPSPTQVSEMTMGRMTMAYGIQLAGGRQLEAYLTPGHPGALHLDFTDRRNSPIALAGPPVVTYNAQGSADSQSLAMQAMGTTALNLGEYFGALTYGSGHWDFRVTATAADGTKLSTSFVLSVS